MTDHNESFRLADIAEEYGKLIEARIEAERKLMAHIYDIAFGIRYYFKQRELGVKEDKPISMSDKPRLAKLMTSAVNAKRTELRYWQSEIKGREKSFEKAGISIHCDD